MPCVFASKSAGVQLVTLVSEVMIVEGGCSFSQLSNRKDSSRVLPSKSGISSLNEGSIFDPQSESRAVPMISWSALRGFCVRNGVTDLGRYWGLITQDCGNIPDLPWGIAFQVFSAGWTNRLDLEFPF